MRTQPINLRLWIASALFSFLGSLSFAQQAAVRPLSLREASQLALVNNFDIQLAQYDAWIARTDNDAARSIYDTMVEAQAGYHNDESKKTSTILGTKTTDNDYNVGLTQKLPTGTTLSSGLTNNRHSTNSSFTTAPLTHDSTWELSVEQNMGKNFFGIQDRGNVKVTQLEVANEEYISLDKIEQSLAQVQKDFWQLVLQKERVRIAEDMLTQAKRLHNTNQEKLVDGLVEIPESLGSEANYKERQNQLLLAQNTFQTKNNVLKLDLNRPDNEALFDPTDKLDIPEWASNLQGAMKNAFAHRRDYKRLANDIKAKKIKLTMKKNNLWPEINLSATFRRNGLGDHFSDSLDNITAEDNPELIASVVVSVPLFLTKERAELKAAKFEKAKAILQLKYLERKIAIDIIDQIRNCQTFKEVADNSDAMAALQLAKLQAQEKRFKAGRSDTDTVIRFQEDAIQAQLVAAAAKHNFHEAVIDLKLKEGSLLNEYWSGDL